MTFLFGFRRLYAIGITIFLVMCLAVCAFAQSQESCGFTSRTRLLVLDLVNLQQTGQPVSPSQERRIQVLSHHLRQPAGRAELGSALSPDMTRALDDILVTANKVTKNEILQYSEATAAAIDWFWVKMDQICPAGSGQNNLDMDSMMAQPKPRPGQSDQGIGRLSSLKRAFSASDVKTTEDQTFVFSYYRFLIWFGLTAGTITSIFVAKACYRWVFALRNKRMTCRIRADVLIGLDVVDGYVDILGRRGCRFAPVNDGAFSRVLKLVATLPAEATIMIGDQHIAVEIHMLKHPNVSMFFDERLSNPALNMLLERSLIAPKLSLRSKRDARRISKPRAVIEDFVPPDVSSEYEAPDLSELADRLSPGRR